MIEVTERQLIIHSFFHTHSLNRTQLDRYALKDYINGYISMRQKMGWRYFSFCGDAVDQSGRVVSTRVLRNIFSQNSPTHPTH